MNRDELIWSKYNHIFTTENNECLLYNSSVNLFLQLDGSLYDMLIELRDKTYSIENIDNDVLDDLILHKILITKKEEDAVFNSKRLRYNINCYNKNTLSLTILPTLSCNLKCTYCFEDGMGKTMNDSVVDDVISFVKSNSPLPNLAIAWFGGEPLVGFNQIKKILMNLNREGIELKHHVMVTNGYLLNKEVCEFFQQYPLDHIQVTIDGTKTTHDKRRVHRSGNGSYDAIIENISTALTMLSNTSFGIRVNVDSTNIEEFAAVYYDLTEKWKDYSNRISVYPGFVTDYSSQKCSQNSCELDRHQRVDFLKKINIEHNIPVNLFPTPKFNSCAASNINAFVIGPEGEIYKCWCDVGIKSKVVAYINKKEITNVSLFANYMAGYTMFDDPICKECSIFPVCEGGCRWFRMERSSDENYLCSLRKGNLDEILTLHFQNKQNSKVTYSEE